MKRKPTSVFRNRKLTHEEIARDEEIRRKVELEFPPAGGSRPASQSVCEAIRAAIGASDRSVEQIAKDAGVSEHVVSRFMAGERVLRVVNAEKLANALRVSVPARSAK